MRISLLYSLGKAGGRGVAQRLETGLFISDFKIQAFEFSFDGNVIFFEFSFDENMIFFLVA